MRTVTDVHFGAGDNYQYFKRTNEAGGRIKTQGLLTLVAGNDLNARAAQVNADGDLAVGAGHNLTITAGQNSHTNQSAEHSHR